MHSMVIVRIMFCVSLLSIMSNGQTAEQTIVHSGKDVIIQQGDQVENAVSVGGDVIIKGEVLADAISIGGTISVDSSGSVGGNAISIGGEIRQIKNGSIRGELIVLSGSWVRPLIRIIAPISRTQLTRIVNFAAFFGFLALSLLVAAIFPHTVVSVADVIRQSLPKSLFWGLVAIIGFVPILAVLIGSFIGLGLVPIVVGVMLFGSQLGIVAMAQLIGKLILKKILKRDVSIIGASFLGILLLWVLTHLPLIGLILTILLAIIGLGAVLKLLIITRSLSKVIPGE